MTSRVRRASWAPLAVVAPASVAFLAAVTMWVSSHDPRDVVPLSTASAASQTASPASTVAAAPPNPEAVLQLARLDELILNTQAQLELLRQAASTPPAAAPVPAPVPIPPTPAAPAAAPAPAPAPDPAPAPPKAKAPAKPAARPAPAVHATTGASGG